MLRNTQEILDSEQCPADRGRDFAARYLPHQPLVWWSRHDAQADRARRFRHRHETSFTCWKWRRDSARCRRAAAGNWLAKGVSLDVTDLDRVPSHLLPATRAVVADALALPFRDASFDLVSCSLFAHHLEPAELARFAGEALRVSRCAVLINDLIRHPLHLALVYAGFPLMRSYVSRSGWSGVGAPSLRPAGDAADSIVRWNRIRRRRWRFRATICFAWE